VTRQHGHSKRNKRNSLPVTWQTWTTTFLSEVQHEQFMDQYQNWRQAFANWA